MRRAKRTSVRPPRQRWPIAAAALLLAMMEAAGAGAQRPDPAGLHALQRDIIELAEKLTPAVVRVASRYTGVIVDGRGYVLSDVAAVPARCKPETRIPVELASGRVLDARPIRRSPRSRTALLRIVKGGRFPSMPAGDSDALRVGDLVLTIGNAFGQASQGGQPAVTVGHVAGLWPAGAGRGIEVGKILTTAAINPGTSGGPLIDIRGSLIGINDQRRGEGDMGQVMPINFIRQAYAGCDEAHRVLSLGARKRPSPRRYLSFMDRTLVRVARAAAPAVVSLVIERAPPPEAKKAGTGGAAVPAGHGDGKKDGATREPRAGPDAKKKKDPSGDGRKPRAGDRERAGKAAGKAQDRTGQSAGKPRPPRPPRKERHDGVKPLERPPRPTPRPRRPGHKRRRPTFKMMRREDPVSGVVIDPRGRILTAAGNLWESEKKKIRRITVVLADGRMLEARRLGTDHHRGLALLQVEATGLPVLPEVRPGEGVVGRFVAVIGNPYGVKRLRHEPFLTWGVLSARNRIDPARAAYQTDAWVNQANQGGALIDLEGRLLGIPVLYRPARYGVNSGVGFAIPVWSARKVLDRLGKGEDIHPGYLGVRLPPVFEPEVRGVRIVEVVRHSPADRAGLRAGDRILAVNGKTTPDMLAVLAELRGASEGDRVEVEVIRGAAPRAFAITAERRG